MLKSEGRLVLGVRPGLRLGIKFRATGYVSVKTLASIVPALIGLLRVVMLQYTLFKYSFCN